MTLGLLCRYTTSTCWEGGARDTSSWEIERRGSVNSIITSGFSITLGLL